MLLLLCAPFLYAADSDDLLAAHNRWRSHVGVPAASWDADLAQSAQARADALASQSTVADPGTVGQHIGRLVVVGENIAIGDSPTAAAQQWGAQQSAYSPESCVPDAPEYNDCGHYAAAVTSYALYVGCGWSKTVLVCRYGAP